MQERDVGKKEKWSKWRFLLVFRTVKISDFNVKLFNKKMSDSNIHTNFFFHKIKELGEPFLTKVIS